MKFLRVFGLVFLAAALASGSVAAIETQPWKTSSNSLVIDACDMNIIDRGRMLGDPRIAAIDAGYGR